jgi:hypothetical protein
MDFLKAIMPSTGFVCVAVGKLQKTARKEKLDSLNHIPFQDVDTLIAGLKDLQAVSTGKEVYFSPATYAKIKDPNNGFRKGDNVLALKSLYVDIDIREEPAFCHSYEDAVKDISRFCEETSFPYPWLVDSGNGIHAYWPLEKELSPVEWDAYSAGFLELVKSVCPRLVADSSRTKDKAALLRLPGFINHKNGRNQKVSVLSEGGGELSLSLVPTKEIDPLGTVADYSHIDPKDKVAIEHVVSACNWMREYVEHKETASEPEWYAALAVGRFTYIKDPKETYESAMALSTGHPGFNPTETIKKLDQLAKASIGPSTCVRLSELAPDRCRRCPLRGMVNSPVSAGRKIANTDPLDLAVITEPSLEEETIVVSGYEIAPPPAPFFFKNDQIFMNKTDSIVRVFDFLVVPINRSKDEYTGQEIAEIAARFPHDGDKIIRVPMSLLADDKKLGIFLADYGILPDRTYAPHFYRYLVSYIRSIQLSKAAARQYSQLGWRFPDINIPEYAEFVLGDMVYTKRGWLANTSISPTLAPSKAAATASGSLEEWKRAFSILSDIKGAEPLIVTALMGFAAPLVEFTPYNGILVNLYGGSGRGKSTAQRFATSIWGVPNERMILTHDNRIPMLNRIGAMRNLPVTFDELTEMDPEALGTLLYEITGGRGKERATVTGVTRANEATWKTIILGSSNISIYSKIAKLRAGNNGQAYRVLEFEVSPAVAEYAIAIDTAKSIIDSNYGMAGRVYAEYLANNVVSVRRKVEETIRAFTKSYQEAPAERFWLVAVATMYVGASIAHELKLHTYDVAGMVNWMVNAMKQVRVEIQDTLGDAGNMLNQFFLENLNNTLRDDGSSSIMIVPNNARNICVRYYGTQKKIEYVAVTKKALIDYCKFFKIELGWLLSSLKNSKALRGARRLDILNKTGLPPVEVDCYIFDAEVLIGSQEPSFIPKEVSQVRSSTSIN